MNSNLTEIICIVDRSGSMSSMRDDAIGGFNSFVMDQKNDVGEVRMTLVLFDNEYDIVYDALPLHLVPLLTHDTFVPRGSTALLDAIGKTIDDVGERLAKTPEADRPGHVIMTILTDGEENSSQHYSNAAVAARISHQRDAYGWEFIFLAANQDAIASAAKLSIASSDAIGFEASPKGMEQGWEAINAGVRSRRRAKRS